MLTTFVIALARLQRQKELLEANYHYYQTSLQQSQADETLGAGKFSNIGVVQEQLQRPQFGMHRFEWPIEEGGGVEFHLSHGPLIDLLRENGFELERLVELQAPANAQAHAYYSDVPAEWGRQWPAEEIWVVRKGG